MTQSSIQSPVTIQELLVSSLGQTDALAKLLIEKGLIAHIGGVQHGNIVETAVPKPLKLCNYFRP
jgi:hypothetical protein